MFKVQSRHVNPVNDRQNPPSETVNQIPTQFVPPNPQPFVELFPVEPDLVFVGSKGIAIEEKEQLVALTLVRSPVDRGETSGCAIDAELFPDFASTRSGWRLTLLDVTAGDVPPVFVRRVNEQHPAFGVDEERACGDPWRGEAVFGRRHASTVKVHSARLVLQSQ